MSYSRTNLNQQFATIVKNEIDNFIANGLLDNATMSLDDFEAALANNSHAPSSPFVFPKNMTLEKYAELVQLYRGNKKNEYLIRGLYAPLLLPWVKRFAKDDRFMVMKFKKCSMQVLSMKYCDLQVSRIHQSMSIMTTLLEIRKER